jgi:hypothetical protein
MGEGEMILEVGVVVVVVGRAIRGGIIAAVTGTVAREGTRPTAAVAVALFAAAVAVVV